MATTSHNKMTKARANLVMAHPFFGALALRMRMEPKEDVKRAATDGNTIFYNPTEIDKMPLSKVQGMIAHTILHPGFLHHTRRGARDYKKWQQACDHSINHILTDAGFDLPEGTFNNPAYKGFTAEHIYTLIADAPNNGKGNGSDPGGDGPGGYPGNDPGGDGEVMDSPKSQNQGASQSEQHAEEAEWKVAVAQAAHVAKQAGNLPSMIERMIDSLLEPIMPWASILHRFATEKSNDDFSWARGNRRFIAMGLYLPSRQSIDNMGAMVVTIDTSGSISDQLLQEFGSEIAAIHRELRPSKLIVIYCDAAVAHVDTFGPEDELSFKLHGGGGTDFRPPFKWIEDQQLDPKCFIYLTDGFGPFPEQPAPYPVLWCINNETVEPPWGEHLYIETVG